jgi:carbon-monoxide dehydrogenase medium subunit
VKDLPSDIVEHDSLIRIGAGELLADLIEDERIQARYPALVEAAMTVGSVQIRNRATLAGNICNASPAADTVPPLLVYDAVVNLVGPGGSRSVDLCDFFVGPGQTVRKPVEIVTSVDLPAPRAGAGAAFARLKRRRGVDLATINVCCLVETSGAARFAFGAAGPRPILVADESGSLADPKADESEKERIVKELIGETRPITDVRGSREYRHAMLFVLSRHALGAALHRRSSPTEGIGT